MSSNDQVQTLLGSLPENFDTIRETFFAQRPLPSIDYIWERMFDKETTYKRREHSSVMRGEVYFQSRGRGGSSRGRGNRGGVSRGGGSGAGRGGDIKSEACFRCGELDHWSRECPKKESVCTWCGAMGHIEKTCYSKANGAARGGKSGGEGGRGRGRGRGGYGRYGGGGEEEEKPHVLEQGHSEVLLGEVNMGGEDTGVGESGADYHMTGDISLFDFVENIPSTFFVKQIKGRVEVSQWGVVRLCTDGVDGEKRELEMREVLYMPGMRVNIFSLQQIRSKAACGYSFQGAPHPGGVIPIINKHGVQIATMRETSKARPTLICTKAGDFQGEFGGEALRAKGIQMELLNKRLGHTSQSVMERLVRDQMVRGLVRVLSVTWGCAGGAKWVEGVMCHTLGRIRIIGPRSDWNSFIRTSQAPSTPSRPMGRDISITS